MFETNFGCASWQFHSIAVIAFFSFYLSALDLAFYMNVLCATLLKKNMNLFYFVYSIPEMELAVHSGHIKNISKIVFCSVCCDPLFFCHGSFFGYELLFPAIKKTNNILFPHFLTKSTIFFYHLVHPGSTISISRHGIADNEPQLCAKRNILFWHLVFGMRDENKKNVTKFIESHQWFCWTMLLSIHPAYSIISEIQPLLSFRCIEM